MLIATPDSAIGEVAALIKPGSAVVLHCSGATRLDVLSGHTNVGSVHPLMALPDPETGAERLLGRGWFAVAGHPLAGELVELLRGRTLFVDEGQRALYHAAAAVSANHLVVLLAQVERLAAAAGLPVEPFLELAQGSFDDVGAYGALSALTGPAARGDTDTLDQHRRALPLGERDLYDALADEAGRLGAARMADPTATNDVEPPSV